MPIKNKLKNCPRLEVPENIIIPQNILTVAPTEKPVPKRSATLQ